MPLFPLLKGTDITIFGQRLPTRDNLIKNAKVVPLSKAVRVVIAKVVDSKTVDLRTVDRYSLVRKKLRKSSSKLAVHDVTDQTKKSTG